MTFKSLSTVLVLSLILAACSTMESIKYQGTQVSTEKPLWLSGVREDNREFTAEFPEREKSEHFEVINAGYWLTRSNPGQLDLFLVYAFDLNVIKHFDQEVYSRAILHNPASPDEPIEYSSPLSTASGSSNITHGPVEGAVFGAEYHLIYEVYADPEYTQLLERIDQPIISPADNSRGCIDIHPGYKEAYFSRVPNMRSGDELYIPSQYIELYCRRR